MSKLDSLIKEVDTLPAKDFIALWDRLQNKVKELLLEKKQEHIIKRPYGLCVGKFTVKESFFEPLSEELNNLFEGK